MSTTARHRLRALRLLPLALAACGGGGMSAPVGDGGVVLTSPTTGALGATCTIPGAIRPDQAAYDTGAEGCASRVCTKPFMQPDAVGPGDTKPYCTTTCADDGDCSGQLRDPANPGDTRCANGFACAVPFTVGSLCCAKLCVCKDFLGPAGLPTPSGCYGDGVGTCSSH